MHFKISKTISKIFFKYFKNDDDDDDELTFLGKRFSIRNDF